MQIKHVKVTIYDVAEKSGFSATTVSRVLSGANYPVNKKTKEVIEKTAKELNYAINFTSRFFDTNKKNEIGLLIPNISNYYYTVLLQGIQQVTTKENCYILLCDSQRSLELERKNVQELIKKGVKGVLIASMDHTGASIKSIMDSGIPVVSMEQKVDVPCITTGFNFVGGAKLAVEHLLDSGHKKISFVAPPLVRSSRKELLSGYRLKLLEENIELNPEYIYIHETEKENTDAESELLEFSIGKVAVDYFLSMDNPPTAMFCVNDLIAIGAIRRLNELKVSIPKQMAVVGFDNIMFSEITMPSLTTIDQSAFEIGKAAATLLFNNALNEGLNENISVLIEPKLIKREST